MSADVRRRAVRAIGASGLVGVLTKILSLLSTLVLVRLLSPSDYGLVAIATAVIGIIGFFNEIGLGSAIVQRQAVTRDELSGCFGIAMIACTLLVIVAVGAAWPVAKYYGMPELGPVLAVLGGCLYLGALNTVPLALLRKDLRFQPVMWSGVLGVLVQSLVAIPLAYLGFKHWAIVVGFLMGQIASLLLCWWSAAWLPGLPIKISAGRTLMGYGLNITANRVLWHVYMNADKLIIGKLIGAAAVGVYDVARSLANLPTSQISGVATNIASPVYARLQSDTAALARAMLRLVRGIAYLAMPVLMGMAALAPDLVMVLAGPQWMAAVWPLRALCLAEMVFCVANLQTQLLISSGNASTLIRYNTVCAIVIPCSLALGAIWGGLWGVGLAWLLAYPLVYLWLLRAVLKVVSVSLLSFWRALLGPVSGALLTGLTVLTAASLMPDLPAWARLFCASTVGTVVYVAYLIFLDGPGLAEIRQVLADLGIPASKLQRWPFSRVTAGANSELPPRR